MEKTLQFPAGTGEDVVFVDLTYWIDKKLVVKIDMLWGDVNPDEILDFLVIENQISSKHNFALQNIEGTAQGKTTLTFH